MHGLEGVVIERAIFAQSDDHGTNAFGQQSRCGDPRLIDRGHRQAGQGLGLGLVGG